MLHYTQYLKKLQQFSPFHVRKQLFQSPVLPRPLVLPTVMHYITTSQNKKKQLQKVQNASAGFVMEKYDTINDVCKLVTN